LFGPMKVNQGGQKFWANNELKCDAYPELATQDKTFYVAGISNLPRQWKKVLV
jgi:hypothetical protein